MFHVEPLVPSLATKCSTWNRLPGVFHVEHDVMR